MRFQLWLALLVVGVQCRERANVDVVNRLYKDVLNNYDKRIRPVKLQSHAVRVYTGFEFKGLRNFDDLSGKANFLSSFTFTWREERISWNVSDYDGIDYIVHPVDDVWTPELIMVNYPDLNKAPGKNSKNVRIRSDGNAVMSSLDILETICSVDIRKYPFDHQVCQLFITPWGFTSSEIELVENHDERPLVELHTESNSAWLMTGVSLSVKTQIKYSGLSIIIDFERRSLYVIANLLVPIFTLGFLNPWVFLLPHESGERTSYSITVLLSFAVYMSILSDNMPKGSEPLADMNFLMISMIVYSAVILFLTIVSLRIYNNENGLKEVPKYLQYCVRILRCKPFHNKCNTSEVKATEVRHQKWVEDIDGIKLPSFIQRHDPARPPTGIHQEESTVSETEMRRANHEVQNHVSDHEATWAEIGKLFDKCAFMFAMVFWGAQLITQYRISAN